MDRPLDSGRSRDHPYGRGGDPRDQYRGGGGNYGGGVGGGYHHRGRGRGRGRGGYRGRGRGRGRGGGRNYNNNNRRGGGGHNNNSYEDPNARLMKQLSVMVSRVGEYKVVESNSSSNMDEPQPSGTSSTLRPVVAGIAKNIADLTKVVSKASNLPTFLKFIPPPPPARPKLEAVEGDAPQQQQPTTMGFQRSPPKAEDQAGPMAYLMVSCAATLPLQTPCYAGLTLSVEAYSHASSSSSNSNTTADYTGFAQRCVTYAMQRLSHDMDTLFLVSSSHVSEARPKIACRIKLMLRYLALLAKVNVVQGQDSDASDDSGAAETEQQQQQWSLLGFLQTLVEAAVTAAPTTDDAFAAASSSNATASLVLAYFVLSTIPYLLSYIPANVIQELLLDPLHTRLLSVYASTFTPGVGMTAILLKEEQAEGANDDDDDDDVEDDDEEEESSEVVCDSLQDLYRSVQLMLKDGSDVSSASRFALLTDAPWDGISGPPPPPAEETSGVKMEDGVDTPAPPAPPTEDAGPLTSPAGSIRLTAPKEGFKSLALLSNTSDFNNGEDVSAAAVKPTIQAFPLEVVVFGRLPIFGAPQTPKEEGDDEDDMDEDDAPANDQVAAYMKGYGVLDRCLLADAIRDLLCCHESSVSGIGQEKGSAKSVAEQIWSLGQALSPSANSEESSESTPSAGPAGLEYGILEAMLSFILQSSSNSTFRQIFLSRVLLELTRLQPALVSPALALAMSNLVQDYIPALVPTARRNLSGWFAFHLANTDYQWPAAYWSHWQTFADSEEKLAQSRGVFVKTTLAFLSENVNNPGVLVKECLPKECQALAGLIVAPMTGDGAEKDECLETIEKDICRRIWDDDEHPESLKGYVVGDELSETLTGIAAGSGPGGDHVWRRSGIVLKSLLRPLEREHERRLSVVSEAQKALENGDGAGDNAMEEDDDLSEDSLAVTLEILTRYCAVLEAAIAKDKEAIQGSESENSLLSTGEPYLLRILEETAGFSKAIMEGCLDFLVEQPNILSGMGVLRWALGDIGGDDQAQETPKVAERWHEFATEAIRVELAKALASSDMKPGTEEGGMIIDRTGEGGMDTEPGPSQDGNGTLAAIESTSPLLDYILRRACTLLVAQADDSQQQGTKLNAQQVDLVEGVKTCLRSTHGLFYSQMRKSNENEKGLSEHEIKECLGQSTVTGSKLAGVCEEFSDGTAVSALRASLATA